MQVDWELSQQFVSDGQGIRAAIALDARPATTNDDDNNKTATEESEDAFQILTGTQGGGLCAFGVPSASLLPVEYQHNHSVTALLPIPQYGLYVTGCKDAKIRLFDVATNTLQATLEGHTKPVTSLSLAATSTAEDDEKNQVYLVSGSWDGTAKVWDIPRRAMMATLGDHENSVSVTGLPVNTKAAGLPSGTLRVATGSAGIAQGNSISDHSVRLWTVQVKTGQVSCTHHVSNDHDGPIRDIVLINDSMLATCSNDGTVKLRSVETAECLSTLVFLQQQHPPMLLSVIPLDDGATIAASAEDGHVVVWNLQEGPDGNSEPQILLHPSCVWKVVALPNGDLATCGDDGSLRIFTRASDRIAPAAEREHFHQLVQQATQKKSTGPTPEEVAKLPLWEQNASRPGTSEGQVMVFNKGGVAIAAQWSAVSRTWIEVGQVTGSSDGGMIDAEAFDHVLPIEVDQTGGGVAKLKIGYNNGENPFVAAQRFIDKYVLPQYHLNEIADYIRQRVGTETPTFGMSGGGGAVAPVATAGMPMISFQHLPMQGYKIFDLSSKTATTTLDKMKTKITEFGKLSPSQLTTLTSLMETLAATSRYHASTISNAELTLLLDMLNTFPPQEAFPALDLARMTILHPDAASSKHEAYWIQVLTQTVALASNTTGLEGPAAVAIPMLALRLFANAFKGGPGSLAAAVVPLEKLLEGTQAFVASTNKNVRLSVATVLYNVSYYLYATKDTAPRPEIAAQIVTVVDTILQSRAYETEAITRSLLALGTTVLAIPDVKAVTQSLYVVSRVEMAASPHGDLAKAIAREVYQVLQ